MTFRQVVQGGAGFVALAAGEWALYATGGGILAGPRLGTPRLWLPWLLSRPPDVALMAMVRLAGLILGAYLLVAFSLGLVVRLLRLRALVAGLDRLTPTALRDFLDRVTGVAAAGAVAVAGMAATAGPVAAEPGVPREEVGVHGSPSTAHGPPVTLRGLAGPQPDPTPTTTTIVRPLPVVPPPVTLPAERQRITRRDVPDLASPEVVGEGAEPPPTATADPAAGGQATDATPTPVGNGDGRSIINPSHAAPDRRRITSDRAGAGTASGAGEDSGPLVGVDPYAATPTTSAGSAVDGRRTKDPSGKGASPSTGVPAPDPTWEVEVGDHFWSIAERALAGAWGRRPSASEIDPYWRALIAANRSRLADPANVDLLFPGQVLVLPPVPVRPAA